MHKQTDEFWGIHMHCMYVCILSAQIHAISLHDFFSDFIGCSIVSVLDSTRRFFSARSVADEWAELPQAGEVAGTQWQEMAEDNTGRRNEFIRTRLVPRG